IGPEGGMAIAIAGGVSFALTDEQKALRALAREFAEKEIRPRAAAYDEHSTHPADVVAKAHELGLMNAHIPAEFGGAELSGFDGMLIGEQLSWGCAGIAVSIVGNTLGVVPLLIAGTDEQRRRFIAPLVEDRKSTRLNSSHRTTSYAVFCLKKKNNRSIENRNKTIHLTSKEDKMKTVMEDSLGASMDMSHLFCSPTEQQLLEITFLTTYMPM